MSYCKDCGRTRSRDRYRSWTAEQRLAHGRKQRALYADRIRKNMREWSRDNPQRRRDNESKRRAKLKDAFAEAINYDDVFQDCDGICGICGLFVNETRWELDHVIPLARGGTHEWGNVQVSHPRCNRSKGARRWPGAGLQLSKEPVPHSG